MLPSDNANFLAGLYGHGKTFKDSREFWSVLKDDVIEFNGACTRPWCRRSAVRQGVG